ncbi:MAG: relaxase/mobilization nuclease domain-containing protein [Bacteroidetes bacterium]|nr:relaxase/mobilization nuclease domain-containing protein [Bacteroidota bacterium]
MVARIYKPAPFRGPLNYNENKIKNGKATCIHEENFLINNKELTFYDKLRYFERIVSLNEHTKNNGLHISLNFDPSEKIEKEKLIEIAKTYMEKIGFANQPYLVYQHNDAGHPHLHILTTLIQNDGKRIDVHNLGKTLSEKARQQIEEDFKLVKAKGKSKTDLLEVKPASAQKAQYGKTETKQAISNVLQHILNNYKFTSLAELNAVLKQYNVLADKGAAGSRMYEHHGLNYFILDEKGNKTGVPIKASLFYFKPTLKNLEKKFADNEIKRQPDGQKLKNAIDWVLASKPKTVKEFADLLKDEKVQLLLRQNENGLIYGLTFIDYRTKSVFNGSDIGKQYSAKAIIEKLSMEQKYIPAPKTEIVKENSSNDNARAESNEQEPAKEAGLPYSIEVLIDPIKEFNQQPYALKRESRQKKKKQSSHHL